MQKLLNKVFHLEERKTKPSIEILAGFITFIAMLYILPVNSGILGDMGMSKAGVFAATAIVSGVISIFMGMYGNFPVVLSAGMGVNAYLAYTVYFAFGNWIAALIVMFLAGIIFLIITLSPVRTMMINAIPNDIKYIISAGLGGFIAFVGLKGIGIINASPATLVSLGNLWPTFTSSGGAVLGTPKVILALVGIFLVFFFMAIKNERLNQLAIPIAMGVTAVVGVIINYAFYTKDVSLTGLPFYDTNATWGLSGIKDVFLKIFTGDANLVWTKPGALVPTTGISAGDAWLSVVSNPSSYAFIFSLIFVNLFDTTATLMSVGRGAGILDEKGELIGGKKAVLADAIGAAVCAPIGTSTVTSFAESNVAVSTGSKTGLSAVTAGLLFIVAAFIFPVFSIFNSSSITTLALVSVGAIMFVNNLKAINWNDLTIGTTAFISFMLMVLTYSISDGLGLGLITYIVMMLAQKRGKEIKPMLYIITGLFLVYYVLKVIVG